MQEPRRWRRLELRVLSVTAAILAISCSSAPRAARAPVVEPPDSLGSEAEVSNEISRSPTSPGPVSLADSKESNSSAILGAPASRDAEVSGNSPAQRELPRGTLVLHIGDSFAGALGIPLGRRLREAGLRTILEFKTASYIPTWAYGKEFPKFVANYNPDLVLITLGANEFDIPDPQQRVRAIERLVRTVGARPCVWISPPRWKLDTGLMNVIREHSAPCRFLDSDTLVDEVPRGRDRIHPSPEGREIWAEAVFRWLADHRHPAAEKPWTFRGEGGSPAASDARPLSWHPNR